MVRGKHPVRASPNCFPSHERIYPDCRARNVLCIWSQDEDFHARPSWPADGHFAWDVPWQGLKPNLFQLVYGPTKVVP
jgi:hypothetical protein